MTDPFPPPPLRGLDNERFFRRETPRGGGSIENDRFFETRGEGAQVANDAFFRTPRLEPPEQASHEFWDLPLRPGQFAVVVAGMGLAAILFLSVDFARRLVIVAPVFEELLKFGVALGLAVLLGATTAGARFVIGLLPGASFGLLEHHVTYPGEDPALYAIRLAFHAGSTALSMVMWSALEPLSEWRYRWASTLPATLVHAANNLFALVAAVVLAGGAAATGTLDEPEIPVWVTGVAMGFTFTAWVAALWILGRPDDARDRVTRVLPAQWFKPS